MWEKCLVGDRQAWDDMKRYNIQDVELLEKIYLRMRPWIKNHPNLGVELEGLHCPKCTSTKLTKSGSVRTLTGVYIRYKCECGSWGQVKKNNLVLKNA